ncbi:protein kinase, partial [Trypanosoma cruzi]
LVRMLALEPTDRPTLQQIIEDEWFGENLDAALFPHRHSLKRSSVFLDFSTQHHVTPEEEAVLEVAFRKIDIDGYGRITRDEVRDMLATLRGERVGAEDVSELIQLFTGNAGSAFITYKQFRDTWVKKDLAHRPFRRRNDFQLSKIIGTQMDMVEREVVRQLRLAFDSVDDLHTGAISVDQWKRLFKRCEIKVTEEEIYSLMRFFDE